jgi:hypothetical protein
MKWIVVKLLILSYMAFFTAIPSKYPYSKERLPEIIVIFFIAFFLVIAAIAIQSVNPYSISKWTKPLLRASPFNMREPIQSLHFLSVCLLVSGAKVFLQAVFQKTEALEGAMMSAAGMGFFIGVRFSILIYHKRIVSRKNEILIQDVAENKIHRNL